MCKLWQGAVCSLTAHCPKHTGILWTEGNMHDGPMSIKTQSQEKIYSSSQPIFSSSFFTLMCQRAQNKNKNKIEQLLPPALEFFAINPFFFSLPILFCCIVCVPAKLTRTRADRLEINFYHAIDSVPHSLLWSWIYRPVIWQKKTLGRPVRWEARNTWKGWFSAEPVHCLLLYRSIWYNTQWAVIKMPICWVSLSKASPIRWKLQVFFFFFS